MTEQAGHIDPESLNPLIEAYRGGDEAAGERLCRRLMPVVHLDTARMLGDDHADVDDVVQESLVASLRYLEAERGFAGDAVRLAVTIARNRCRDLMRRRSRRAQVAIEPLESWLADDARSALDDIAERQLVRYLQDALDRVSAECRRLLRSLYVEGQSPREVQIHSGLRSVQGVYYRRGICLERLKNFLHRHMRFGSWGSAAREDAAQETRSERGTGESTP